MVWALDALFSAPFGDHLVFKGGTSLSKGYDVIRRFSEDVDLTYDIRELVTGVSAEVEILPRTSSQAKKLTDKVRKALPIWVHETAMPAMQAALDAGPLNATVRCEGENLFIAYRSLNEASGYINPSVKLEFGARSTGEPSEILPVRCDAALYIRAVQFPEATARVMRPERTFWEKATLIHVLCANGMRRLERSARHWHDIVRLDDAGFVESALRDFSLATQVAAHKAKFFAERDSDGMDIDYAAAVGGAICLVPQGPALELLREDYKKMVDAGLLLDDLGTERFEDLMARCAALQRRANSRAVPTTPE